MLEIKTKESYILGKPFSADLYPLPLNIKFKTTLSYMSKKLTTPHKKASQDKQSLQFGAVLLNIKR